MEARLQDIGNSHFTRRTPGQVGARFRNGSLLYKRARYYDTSTSDFISRDPLEYVDGMSMMRGYMGIRGIDPLGLDWLDNLANFTAGGADSLTMGVHGWVRKMVGINDGIDVENGWYFAGEVTEIAVETTLTLGAASSRHVAKRVVRSKLERGARSRYRRRHNIRGGIIHHATPIKGHPPIKGEFGGQISYFPLPYKFAARGSWNFQYVANVAEHRRMHMRLRKQEAFLKYFNMSQPVRNGGNLLMQHVLNAGPNGANMPFGSIEVNFAGERTLYYDSCDPNPKPFSYSASGSFFRESMIRFGRYPRK